MIGSMRACLGALLLCTLAGRAMAACDLGAIAVLPLQNDNDGQIVTIDINGHPARLVLDTGAFATTLKRSAAERLGIRMSELDADSYGVGGNRHLYRGTAKRMRIGGLSADGMVLAGQDFFARPSDADTDGLFGMNMMAAYDIDLDLPGDHVVLYEADGNCGKTHVAGLAPPLYMVPLEYIEHDRQADVELLINGHRVRAVIDSGAAKTVIFRNGATRLGINMAELRAGQRHMGRGIGPRLVAEYEHVFETVQIGDLRINNMRIAVLDQADVEPAIVHVGTRLADPSLGETGGEEMLLGADFMRKVHLWISHSSHKLVMQYPPQPSVLPH